MNILEQSCRDIIYKNMKYENQCVYMLYDTESPLAKILFSGFSQILPENSQIREFEKPPQPLYRGGLINPENPHIKEQNRLITSHNIEENKKVGLDHHIRIETESAELLDPQIESIKKELISLPAGSIVVLIQSTNFRLSTFRIRLELFHRGIHVIEFNHLAYIKDVEIDTFKNSLIYRTDEYLRLENAFQDRMLEATSTRIISQNGDCLTFGPLEKIRGNTGDYTQVENKGGTFPIGEVFTEARDLSCVNGKCLIESFPNEDFSVNHSTPFLLTIENGSVLPSPDFPSAFAKLYNWIKEYEGEVIVRELGFGLNPAITSTTPLSDINFYERKTGVHLSLGKKHGIYGKKLPKSEVQRFHIDVFVALEGVFIQNERVFMDGKWQI